MRRNRTLWKSCLTYPEMRKSRRRFFVFKRRLCASILRQKLAHRSLSCIAQSTFSAFRYINNSHASDLQAAYWHAALLLAWQPGSNSLSEPKLLSICQRRLPSQPDYFRQPLALAQVVCSFASFGVALAEGADERNSFF